MRFRRLGGHSCFGVLVAVLLVCFCGPFAVRSDSPYFGPLAAEHALLHAMARQVIFGRCG